MPMISIVDKGQVHDCDAKKDIAREYAEKALALLDSHKTPLSSWSDTEQRRDEIRHNAQRTLEQAIKGPDQ